MGVSETCVSDSLAAPRAADSLGRAHTESCAEGCDPFEFDLRRITACSAFRRLQYKTQVFVSPRGDHFRTRLTHTLEVASIARRLARQLRLNVALAEAVALAHDLGHPPFGHAGERALNCLLADDGGFEHNTQSLRVVDYLEHPFPAFRGLNLTYEVREALIKHHTLYDRPHPVHSDDTVLLRLLQAGVSPTLEAQVVAIADRVAYDCHDLEDGLSAELLDDEALTELTLWRRSATDLRQRFPQNSLFAIWRGVLENFQQYLLSDVTAETQRRIRHDGLNHPDEVRGQRRAVVRFSDAAESELSAVESLLHEKVYAHPDIRRLDDMAGRMITELFRAYVAEPKLLPERFRRRIREQGHRRVVCDYVAGMTDRFCENEYRRIFLPFAQHGRA